MELLFSIFCVFILLYILYPKRIFCLSGTVDKSPVLAISLLVLIRLLLILICCLGSGVPFERAFSNWDGTNYLFLAEHGYVGNGDGVQYIVFFPFYPIMVKLFQLLIRNYFWAAILVSNLSLVLSAVYLYKLARMDLDRQGSLFAVLLLVCSPFSFFLSGVYTESLFLLLTLLCFYTLRKKKWLFCGIFGMFAAFTRIQGFLLLIPALYECLRDRQERKYWFYCLLIPLGLLAYLGINQYIFGDFFAFTQYQKDIWHQQPAWFGKNLASYAGYIREGSDLSLQIMLPQLLLFFGGVLLLWRGLKKELHISYALYAAPYILVVYSASWLLSGGRYMMTLFPLYLAAAFLVKNKSSRALLLGFSTILLVIYTLLFMQGKQIM